MQKQSELPLLLCISSTIKYIIFHPVSTRDDRQWSQSFYCKGLPIGIEANYFALNLVGLKVGFLVGFLIGFLVGFLIGFPVGLPV